MLKMLSIFVLLVNNLLALSFGVNLTWDTVTNAVGYKLYQGPSSRNYSKSYDVGNISTYDITPLLSSTPSYFAAVSYIVGGLESIPSNEVVVSAAVVPPSGDKVLLIVEDMLWTNCSTKINQLVSVMTSEGLSVTTIRYDSRGKTTNSFGQLSYNNTINFSSKAAKLLAINTIWPFVNSGGKYVFCIGEIPYAMAGINTCPDGHGSTFTWDGYRDSQNTAGSYPCLAFYGVPGNFTTDWTDINNALLSINTIRMNCALDGKFDNEFLPSLPKAAVGYIGGFGDQALDPNGLVRRGNIINNYIDRDIKSRTGQWPSSGACYQFQVPSPDNHSDLAFWSDLVTMYGTNAISNGQTTVIGANLTNRPIAFNIVYGGADTYGYSWLGAKMSQLQKPFAKLLVIRQSYSVAIPANSTSWVARSMIDNQTNGPVAAMFWDLNPKSVGWDIKKLSSGKRIGDMLIEATPLSRAPAYPGLYGDPTLRIQ